MRDLDAVERATIAVEQIKGPVLMVSGRDDQLWPSFELAEIARRRLEEHNHPWPFEHISYPDAGHGMVPPYAPTTATTIVHPVTGRAIAFGGTPRARSRPTSPTGGERSIFLRKPQLTLRRRSPKLLTEVANLPASAWRTVELDVPHRKYRHPRFYEQKTRLLERTHRQFFITDLGHDEPTRARPSE